MPLFRPFVRPKQRTDSLDFNRQGDLGLANLELALRHFLLAGSGLMRGGTVTADSGMFVRVAALAGVTSTVRAVILEGDTTVGPFGSNGSGNPRIDLVSITISDEATSIEQRNFVNSDVNPIAKFDQDVTTRIETRPVLTITQGTPHATTPVAPATPAGHIALAEVRINSGATQIVTANITQRFDSRLTPQRTKKTADTGSPINIPWESDRLEKVVTPAGSTTVFEGQVEFIAFNFTDTVLVLEVVDKTNANAVVAQATYSVPTGQLNPVTTFTVRGAVDGPRGPADYVLRLRRSDNASGATLSPAKNTILIARTF